jgi:hypothetical protein
VLAEPRNRVTNRLLIVSPHRLAKSSVDLWKLITRLNSSASDDETNDSRADRTGLPFTSGVPFCSATCVFAIPRIACWIGSFVRYAVLNDMKSRGKEPRCINITS